MNGKTKKYVIGGIVFLIIAVLLGWGQIAGTVKPVTFWNGTDIQCLPNGHVNLGLHIHPMLSITVDGEPEPVAHVGDSAACMAEVHTHDSTGKIHIESTEAGKRFTLADFFTVWGQSMERPGYTLVVTANGAAVADPASLVLFDNQQITLEYTSNVAGTSTADVLQ